MNDHPAARLIFFSIGLVLNAANASTDASLAASTVRPYDYKPPAGNSVAGKGLFNDAKLSTNGMSCASCHANHAAFSASFARPYPHLVAMAREQLGRKRVHLDEMVQACMVMPMAAKPLSWKSQELADLTAYTAELQKTFKPAR